MRRKKDPLVLTKAQTTLLRSVENKEVRICSCRENMELKFIMDDERILKKVMLVLFQRQLVRICYQKCRIITTKLGSKLAKLAKDRQERLKTQGAIVGLGPQNMYASMNGSGSQYKRQKPMYR